MAEKSSVETISKFGVGLGVGFALYYLIRNLGFGGRFGFGGGSGEARDEVPTLPAPPPMPKDEQRLEFVMVGPTTLDDKTLAFRGPGGKIYSLEEMIMRIKAGGRNDMTLKIRGDVISGPADVAEAQIKNAGIDIWQPAPPPAAVKAVSGNARGRGQYDEISRVGRGYYRGYER
jgi:hypothetical protein